MTTEQNVSTIEGYVERMNVYNESFYVLTVFTSDDEHKRIVGNTDKKIEEQGYYTFTVVEKMHPRYGKGFHFIEVEKTNPVDKKNIIKILKSNIKGVGDKSALKIYETLGEETLSSLAENPKIVYDVSISKKAQTAIFEHFNEMNSEKEQLLKLQGMGLSDSQAYDILFKMKEIEIENPVEQIKENPYVLRELLKNKNFGFWQCDFVGKKIGFPKNHPIRIEECTYHILREALQSGDVCISKLDFNKKMQIYLGLPLIEIQSIKEDIELSKEVEYEYYNDFMYLKSVSYIEQSIAFRLAKIHMADAVEYETLEEDITKLIEKERVDTPGFQDLHPNQKDAIKMVFQNNLSILSGGPGTGKTTILKFIINLCKKYDLTFKLAAPTGMASKKMSLATNQEAKTIHRALECDMSSGHQEFLRNEDNPFEEDIIIVDESSMVDIFMFLSFLQAVGKNTKLVIIGDPDQLPSVGAGKIFDDIIRSNKFPHVHLSKIYRQGKNSMIVENAYRINNQQEILMKPTDDFVEDFYFVQMPNEKDVAQYIKELVSFRLKDSKGFDPMTDIQILLPRKKGELGVLEYNPVLQQAINPPSPDKNEITFKSRWIFREQDKVMQTSNNPEKEVFNGDIGYIQTIDLRSKTVTVDFSDKYNERLVDYTYEELEEIMLAYSISVHKSQGSEYPVVLMPVIQSDYMMLYKELVYTAVTRGRQLVMLIGDKTVLDANLYAREEQGRNSNLSLRIEKVFEEFVDNEKAMAS